MTLLLPVVNAWSGPAYITNFTASLTTNHTMTASFGVEGGSNGVPYDIYRASTLPQSLWTWLGPGLSGNTYTFSNTPASRAFFSLGPAPTTMAVVWGTDLEYQTYVPYDLRNVVALAAGYDHCIALHSQGTVETWGSVVAPANWIPANLPPVMAIAAGWDHNVVLLYDRTVTAWTAPYADYLYGLSYVPSALTNAATANVIAIAAGGLHSLALRVDGTVLAWGNNASGETSVPVGLSNVVAIAAGGRHSLAAKSDGTVSAWGMNLSGQCNVPNGLSNVTAIAAGWAHSLALKTDGTVAAWGDNSYGETDIPAGLSNVVAIAAGGSPFDSLGHYAFSLALQTNGTVVVWGSGPVQEVPHGMDGVIGIGAGVGVGVAVRYGNLSPVIIHAPTNQYQLLGGNVTFTAEGYALAAPQYQWQYGGVNIYGATNSTLTLTNVGTTNQGNYSVVICTGTNSITSSNATFTLVTPPVITSHTQPSNQIAVYQSNFTLSVSATAPGQSAFPISYQWQLNGSNIYRATNASYTFAASNAPAATYSVVVSNAAGSTNATWLVSVTYDGSYIALGTLAYHLSTNAVARTNGISDIYNATRELSGWVYSDYYPTNLPYLTNSIWSTNFWLKGVQGLSATSIGFLNVRAAQGSVTMISPRHCVYANHMHLPPGYFTAAFLDTNNVIHWRTNMENIFVTNDISIGILDSDLPASVGFLPVLPTNCFNYLPTNGLSIIQGIGRNQDVRMFGQPMKLTQTDVTWNVNDAAPFGLTTNWNVQIRGGDSSNPEMLLISNQLVFVTHIWSAQEGPNYVSQFNLLNQCMHYLSTNNNAVTDYQLTPFCLTNWPVISQ